MPAMLSSEPFGLAASVGSPECALISAGVAQLARQYRLPSYIAGA